MEGMYQQKARELEEDLGKYKELIKYVETRYTSMLKEEEDERDEEVSTVLQKGAVDLND